MNTEADRGPEPLKRGGGPWPALLWVSGLLAAAGVCWLAVRALTPARLPPAEPVGRVGTAPPALPTTASTTAPTAAPQPPAKPAPDPRETLRLSHELLVGDRDQRREAARKLATIADPGAIEALRNTFAASDEARRKEMAEDLAALRTPAAMQILRLALDDKSHAVKAPVVNAMEGRGGDGRVELIACALGSADEWVRLKAVMATYGLTDRRLVPLLRKAVDDQGRGIGAQAAEMLGAVGGKESLPTLIDLLSHADWKVRHGAVMGFGPACRDTGYTEEVLSALLKTLAREEGGQTYQVRFAAAVMLGGVKTQRVRDAMIAQLNVETYELPRTRILEILAKTFADDPVAQEVVKRPPPMPTRDYQPPAPAPMPAPTEVF